MTLAPTAPAWRQVTARVARQAPYGAGHRWLEVEIPGPFATPLPGQFVQLLLGPTAAGTLLPRPMSVAGAKRHGRALRVSFLYAPVGVGTHALARLAPGQEVDVLGPLGHGFPLDEPGTTVMVAGGRGVAPLLYAAGARRFAGLQFLFGARSAAQLIGVPAARATLRASGGRLHLCTDDGSRGARGTVVDLLERLAPRWPEPVVVHACGPHGMLRAIAEWAIARDVRAWLAMESVMACGTGVCRGCPLPRSDARRAAWTDAWPSLYGNRDYAMCCAEGPVFEARDLDWESVT